MERAVLGLGSNVPFARLDGSVLLPRDLLDSACVRLQALLVNFRVSEYYKTAPMHYENQPFFLNAVACGGFNGSARELLSAIQCIEAEFGRNRAAEIPKGPRTLDIDIELFGTHRIREADLIIPHQNIQNRPFVLVPLLEILPDCADPISGEKYSAILNRLNTSKNFSL